MSMSRPIKSSILAILLAAIFAMGVVGCGNANFRKGCKKYCKCHHGERSVEACREGCYERLSRLEKRDRLSARQIGECLAARGERSCSELAACAGKLIKK